MTTVKSFEVGPKGGATSIEDARISASNRVQARSGIEPIKQSPRKRGERLQASPLEAWKFRLVKFHCPAQADRLHSIAVMELAR